MFSSILPFLPSPGALQEIHCKYYVLYWFSIPMWKITTNVIALSHKISSQFHDQKTNTIHLDSLLGFSESQSQGICRSTSLTGDSRRTSFQAHSGCWQNSVSCSYKTEVLVALLKISGSHYHLPEAAHTPSHVASSIFC